MKSIILLLLTLRFCLTESFGTLFSRRFITSKSDTTHQSLNLVLRARVSELSGFNADNTTEFPFKPDDPDRGVTDEDFITNYIQESSFLEPSDFNLTKFFLENQFDDVDVSIASKLLKLGLDDVTVRNAVLVLDVNYRETLLRALSDTSELKYSKSLESLSLKFKNLPNAIVSEKLVNRTGNASIESVLDNLVVNAFFFGDIKNRLMRIIGMKEFQTKLQSWLKYTDERILNITIHELNVNYRTSRSKDLILGYVPSLAMWLNAFVKVMTDEVKAGRINEQAAAEEVAKFSSKSTALFRKFSLRLFGGLLIGVTSIFMLGAFAVKILTGFLPRGFS